MARDMSALWHLEPERVERAAMAVHRHTLEIAAEAMGVDPETFDESREEAVAEGLPLALAVAGSLRAPLDSCEGCLNEIALFCPQCARKGVACGHVLAETYCESCAVILPRVENSTETRNEDGIAHNGDFEHWSIASAEGAPVSELRLIAGWVAGWRLQDGSRWPLPDVNERRGSE